MSKPTAVSLSIFRYLFASVAEEMGVTLGRAAYSPNIKERLDFSCALFLGDGRMLAQAAHIPVHLGAMPASVQAAINQCAPFAPGDIVIVNDPYQGGNHLPDITLVSPVFFGNPLSVTGNPTTVYRSPITDHRSPSFFVASRAHHADVGGMSPGSMPLSTEIYQEGIIIPPIKLVEAGRRNEAVWQLILRNVRTPEERNGDLAAQLAAHAIGEKRLAEIISRYSLADALAHAEALIDYAKTLTETAVTQIPNGRYTFTDYLDDDGQPDSPPIPIKATLTVDGSQMHVDFTGTAPAVRGNLNAVPAIAKSAVAYCLRCAALALVQTDLPMNDGAFAPLTITIPPGSLLDPPQPHAVAAGNVETSQRITDAVFGALAQALPDLIPAASQGTMNNLTFGGKHPGTERPFAYYETIGGGAGAGPTADGGSGMHVHMSNTLNTPVEALEYSFPLRLEQYSLRPHSGGDGQHQGGDGLVRSIRFLTPVTVTVTSERRQRGAYGLQGGEDGRPGQNRLIQDEISTDLTGKFTRELNADNILRIETPGGGGWGPSPQPSP
ncbi:MAG: hydantoinase B/oxoprolinase family protein [Ardenticatenaceae bacterium]|nr:hydantoinase B/oxoprolinase family protein [Anaerolineales bacterium]MCB8937480.1 hydantoinase B/oxoprolinase family protein [Ardenticatenaceae bacterium]MCB8975539.1 hydantoinase B/oxoprolinase family protein [Ardenticatenaceae bacterium]